ncbi:MAG: branched-chain amino acid ABC transporter permease [SAR116 cluster bacterium]|nr:branched-chain amino acid ABC transporter permease [SAR116 cluster bacterium]
MTLILLLEQLFNGLQFGVTLFLIAAGLTLILGIMDFVFLAHGAQVMIGAYAAASLTSLTGNFFLGILLAIPITFASGFILEYVLIRHLYRRDHMDQVLATFGLILFFNELIRIGFGPAALFSNLPPSLSGFIYILPETPYPAFRLIVIFIGLVLAIGIYILVAKTRMGAMVRAGASNPDMTAALGVNIHMLRRFIFSVGASLAGVAGMMLAPLTVVEPGMGEPLLILSLVVIIIGGIGSVRGAFIAAVLVGLVDTIGRVFLPEMLRAFMSQSAADGAGPALASMIIYILMAVILVFKPTGLFPPKG